MNAKHLALLAALLGLLVAAPALGAISCPAIDLSLDKHNIEMGMTYDGEDVTVSGQAPAGSQVAIVLVSKENPPMQLSRKGRVGLFWMSVKQLEACNMPFLYRVYSSGPLPAVASAAAIKELGLGYDTLKGQLVAKCTKGEPAADDADVLFDGFLKLKEDAGLYAIQESGLQVAADGRFQQEVYLPDRVSEGTYLVHAYAFKDGQLIGAATREVSTRKVGLGKWLVVTAQHSGVLYGVIAVVVALGAGLGIGAIFKKGASH